MAFDFGKTIQDMLTAMVDSIRKDGADISPYAREILDEERESLEKLANLRLKGEITDEELESELEDEKDTIEAQLKALTVLGKASAQKATNAAIDVFYAAVKAAL